MALELKIYVENLFKKSEKFCDKDGNIFINKILESIEKIDKDLVRLLLSDEKVRNTFFMRIDDIYVLNQNDLIEFFTLNDYMQNSSYTAYTNKIGLIRKDNFIKKFDDVVLAFPHKDCVLEGGASKDDDKQKETFYNSILSSDEISRLFEPKALTNIKRYSKDGVAKNPDINIDDNLIIKGNNLIALHSLKKLYRGKVKLIYIDPPYNTGNDSFNYNDNFNHSTWLTFMKNRLEVAREFLSDDGVIFVSIDDHEQAYLKVLMDEIFQPNNFITTIIWHSKYTISNDAKYISTQHENIHFYAKEKTSFSIGLLDRTEKQNKAYTNPDNDPKGRWKATPIYAKSGKKENNFLMKFKNGLEWSPPKGTFHRYSKSTLNSLDITNQLHFNKNGGVDKKTYLSEVKQGVTAGSIWHYEEVGHTHSNNDELASILDKGVFDNPKGTSLLKQIIKVANLQNNDIILDFHAGSGTTAHAVLDINKEQDKNLQFILIEQMDYIEDITCKRVQKVMEKNEQGSFIYAELKEINNFTTQEIGKLNTNMHYLPLAEIEDDDYGVSHEEIEINKKFYGSYDE